MELSMLAIIVWAELTFLLAGGLILLLVNSALQRSSAKKNINTLLDKLKTNRDTRLTEIRKGLKQYGLDGEVLEEKVKAIDIQERKLLERVVGMYRKRSDLMLARLDLLVETATKPYFELDVAIETAAAAAQEDNASSDMDQAELEQLRAENKQLQEELSVTMDTIGRMLSEYSSMFGTDDEGDLDKGKIMEAFNVDEQGEELEVAESSAATEAAGEEDLEVVSDEIEPVETDELLEIDDALTEAAAEAAPEPEAEPGSDAGPEAVMEAEPESDAAAVAEASEAENVEPEPQPEPKPEPDVELSVETDEAGGQAADDELDVVIDDVDPAELSQEVASAATTTPDELDAIVSELGESLDDELLGAVTLDDNDIADLEAAGLDDIVDLETDPIDELVDLGDDLDFDVDLDAAVKKAADEKTGDTAAIDDLDIDSLIDANKKA